MRALRIAAGVLAACALAPAQQGTSPRAKSEDYPVHGQLGAVGVGAEYLVRSFSHERQSYFTGEYLVVEVAFFPPRGGFFSPATTHFALRLNHRKKDLISADSPGAVAASLRYADWRIRPRLEAEAGVNDGDIILGRPTHTGRFPGDRRAPQPPPGTPPRTPTDAATVERQPRMTADAAAVEAALPADVSRAPVSGYLFFPYTGKTKKIKAVELILRRDEGETVLRLF